MPCFGVIENLDDIKKYGEGYIFVNTIPNYPEGLIFSFYEEVKDTTVQLYFSYNGTYRLQRLYVWDSKTWSSWKEF